MLCLVLGGRRSGKSDWAEQQALASSRQNLVYLATCRPSDKAMQERVALHRNRRAQHPRTWILREEPVQLAAALDEISRTTPDCLVLLDCLTLWLANLMETHSNGQIAAETDRLLEAAQNFAGDLIVVSNEVGLGIAPASELGNRFIDQAGILNRKTAHVAAEVVFITAGLPFYLKQRS